MLNMERPSGGVSEDYRCFRDGIERPGHEEEIVTDAVKGGPDRMITVLR